MENRKLRKVCFLPVKTVGLSVWRGSLKGSLILGSCAARSGIIPPSGTVCLDVVLRPTHKAAPSHHCHLSAPKKRYAPIANKTLQITHQSPRLKHVETHLNARTRAFPELGPQARKAPGTKNSPQKKPKPRVLIFAVGCAHSRRDR